MQFLSFDIGIKTLSYALVEVARGSGLNGHARLKGMGTIDCARGPPLRLSQEYLVEFLARPENKWMFADVDIVILEQQLRANPQMQCMASTLHAALLAYATSVQHRIKVVYINSSAKFKAFGAVVAPPDATRAQYYTATKKRAIEIAKQVVDKFGGTEEMEAVASGSRDIADAIGNCAAYLVKEKWIKW